MKQIKIQWNSQIYICVLLCIGDIKGRLSSWLCAQKLNYCYWKNFGFGSDQFIPLSREFYIKIIPREQKVVVVPHLPGGGGDFDFDFVVCTTQNYHFFDADFFDTIFEIFSIARCRKGNFSSMPVQGFKNTLYSLYFFSLMYFAKLR